MLYQKYVCVQNRAKVNGRDFIQAVNGVNNRAYRQLVVGIFIKYMHDQVIDDLWNNRKLVNHLICHSIISIWEIHGWYDQTKI